MEDYQDIIQQHLMEPNILLLEVVLLLIQPINILQQDTQIHHLMEDIVNSNNNLIMVVLEVLEHNSMDNILIIIKISETETNRKKKIIF
jgi:hypothetical protein